MLCSENYRFLSCNQPLRVHNWEVLIHFNVHGHGKDLFGDGFAFWYTKEKGKLGEPLCLTFHHLFLSYDHQQCVSTGPVFGNTDYFTGLGVFFDTYSNYNGVHSVRPSLLYIVRS